MARVKFTVGCIASYESELEIPEEIKNDEKAVLEYIHEHLDECEANDLEWTSDLTPSDAVLAEDIIYIE